MVASRGKILHVNKMFIIIVQLYPWSTKIGQFHEGRKNSYERKLYKKTELAAFIKGCLGCYNQSFSNLVRLIHSPLGKKGGDVWWTRSLFEKMIRCS